MLEWQKKLAAGLGQGLATCAIFGMVASCSVAPSSQVLEQDEFLVPQLDGQMLVMRVPPAEAANGGSQDAQAQPQADTPTETWFCVEKVSDQAGQCKGMWVDGKGTNPLGPGTCVVPKAGDKISSGADVSVTCEAAEGKSCLSTDKGTSTDLIRFKLKSVTAATDPTKVAESYLVGDKGEVLWAMKGASSCSKAIATAKESYRALQPKLPAVLGGQCSIEEALTAVKSAEEEGSGSTPLQLAGAPGVPERSACFDLPGVARTQCLINGSLAIEIHEVFNLSDIEAVKRGERYPKLCLLRAPEPKDRSLAALHHIIRDPGSGARVAYARTGSLTFENNSLRYSFQDFKKVGNLPFLSTGLEMGVVTPEGEPDGASGVWKADLGRVLRFVPQQWCAQSYLNASLSIEQVSGNEGSQSQGSERTAPEPEGPEAGAEGSGGSGGKPAKTCE